MGRPGLTRNRKFARLERLLASRALARGHLELLWEVAYENGDDLLGDVDDVEHLACWKGESGALAAALVESGFLDLEAGEYRVHDLWDHAPDYVRRRAAREAERRRRGETLAAARARAGKKGGQQRAANAQACAKQTADRCLADGDTPTPTPARVPSSSCAGDDAVAGRWPLVADVLASLQRRGFDAEWPAEDKTADRLEQAIRDVGRDAAEQRIWNRVTSERQRHVSPKTHLGWYLDTIRGERMQRTHGDLGVELRPWCSFLSDEEQRQAASEIAQRCGPLDPEFKDAPLGIQGDPSSPAFAEFQAIQMKWRAFADARRPEGQPP